MKRERTFTFIVVCVLAFQGALLAFGSTAHSPVIDELAHLVAGLSNWQLGRFGLYIVNPPLVRMIAATPVIVAGAHTDWHRYSEGIGCRPEFAVQEQFVRINGPRVITLITLARCVLIPLVLLGGYTCYCWARDLYGHIAGVIAAVLWCFCPNLLAYGQLINADASATALGVVSQYCFWKWLKRNTWDRALVAGISLGVVELTKTTWIVLIVLWPALWLASLLSKVIGRDQYFRLGRTHDGSSGNTQASDLHSISKYQQTLQIAAILLVGVLFINAAYGFEDSWTALRSFSFLSRTLRGGANAQDGNRFAASWLGGVPLPLPKKYVEGIDLQWYDIEVGKASYMRGKWKNHGWWYWYLYAFALKVPLGTWGLLLLAAYCRASAHLRIQVSWKEECFLLAPAVVVLLLVSSQTGFSRYIRYALPALPFVFVWISSVGSTIEEGIKGLINCWRARFNGSPNNTLASDNKAKVGVAATGALLLVWSVCSSMSCAPHWLSYFNEMAGGPIGGPSHLVDAQVDWGQDLLYLRRWLDDHPAAEPLGLVYFGPLDPNVVGIEFALPPRPAKVPDNPAAVAQVPDQLKAGWYAISVNFLFGYPYVAADGNGGIAFLDKGYYTFFRRFEPVATAGYSIYIYHLTDDNIQAANE
jgi:hypothetical protein